MSISQSFLCFGFFELWNPNRVTVENPKTKRSSYFYTYDSELLGRNNISRRAQIRSYSRPGSVPYPPNTIVFVFGRAAISKDDNKTLLIEVINAFPFGGDPNAEDYDENIPEMLPQFVAVGHVMGKAAPIGPSGALRGFPLNTSEYVRDVVINSSIQSVSFIPSPIAHSEFILPPEIAVHLTPRKPVGQIPLPVPQYMCPSLRQLRV